MRYFAYLFWLLVMLVGITFASLNSQSVEINYYINQHQMHLPLLILLVLLLGTLLGWVAVFPTICRLKIKNHQLKNRLKQLEIEVNNLRTIPIKDSH